MIHVDESTLLAYLDGQASATREEVATHLAACPRCMEELRSLRDMTVDLRAALTLTDVPAPVDVARARFDAARREVRRGSWSGVRLGPFRVGVLQAAVLALVLAGVAGAAIPGSPLRLWLESAFGGEADEAPVVAPVPVAPDPSAEPSSARVPEPNEMRVDAVDGRVVVALREPPVGGRLIVRLTDDEMTTVEAVASFTRGMGRIEAHAIGGDAIVVTLPRTIGSARIEVDGRLLVHREDGAFSRLPSDALESGGEIVIPLRR